MKSKPTYKDLEQRVQKLEKELVDNNCRNEFVLLNQQYLQAILNNTNLPIYLKDSDYNYIFVNKQYEYLAHVTNDQIQGKDDFAIFPEPIAQLFRDQDEEVVQRKTLIEFEETILLPEGVQSFITSKFPLIDNKGDIYAVGGVCTDITERKRTEAKLKETEEKYRSIFEYSPFGIVHLDKEGIVTACNKKLANILGSNVEKIKGLDTLKHINDGKIKTAIKTVLSGKIARYKGKYQSVTGGGEVYIRAVSSPMLSYEGSLTGAIIIIEDITERMEAETALRKTKGELEQRVTDRTAQLDLKNERLMETNTALKILLEKREEDKKELEEGVMFNLDKLILPHLEKLKIQCNDDSQKTFLNVIQSNLEKITSSFEHFNKNYLSKLTPTQIQIADLIKQGQTTKEIASLLNLSPLTISRHRQEIRKRLSLTNRKINLQSLLNADC